MFYGCPFCGSRLDILRTYDKRTLVRCDPCRIARTLGYFETLDEAYLEFFVMCDGGQISVGDDDGAKDRSAGGPEHDAPVSNPQGGLPFVRDAPSIKNMIGDEEPDPLVREILYTKTDYIVHYEVMRRQDPPMGDAVSDMGLDKRLAGWLEERGIPRLYRFQQEAVSAILRGENTVIEAPTASGKTEAFLIPVLEKLLAEGSSRGVRAIFVYPTKSLARDQSPKIGGAAAAAGLSMAVFDGDTGMTERRRILQSPPDILVTNFDLLHYHMWHRGELARLLSGVRHVIVDEVHTYSGIFGSNVHYVLKRLGRLTGRIQFVAASATLGAAGKFCEKLFSAKFRHIRGEGAKSEIEFVMLFPSLRPPRQLMLDITERLVKKGHRSLVFSNSHMGSELVAIKAKRRDIQIRVHRAGLTAKYRKRIEDEFKRGEIMAISCTPTLELGIDIGGVDGVVSSSVPINRLTQRMGRAARRGRRGYAFLALGDDPISQYYMMHPEDYFDDAEELYIDAFNPFVEESHVAAMACDSPIREDEMPEHAGAISRLLKRKILYRDRGRYMPRLAEAKKLLDAYSIRGIGSSIGIVCDRKHVGDRVLPIALEELHKNAIYFLAGKRYKVLEFDYPKRSTAVLEKLPPSHPYYTRALKSEWPRILETHVQKRVFGMQVAFCSLEIKRTVNGYVEMMLGEEASTGNGEALDPPLEYDFVTKGIVFHAPAPADSMKNADDPEYVQAGGFHAAEHVIIEGSNMITGGVSKDLGGISLAESGMIFVYDGAIGGNGASRSLYDRLEAALVRSREILAGCPCRGISGCPRCTFSYQCGNRNEFLHKAAALEVLERICRSERTEIIDPGDAEQPYV